MNSEQRAPTPNRMAELRDRISDCFSPDDLHGLAFDFGLDLDKFEGSSFDRRVIELIEIILRQQQLVEFIERCHEKKPRGNFQPLLSAAHNEPHSFQLQPVFGVVSPSPEAVDFLSKSIAMFMLREQSNREAEQIQAQKPISQADFSKPASLRKSDIEIHSRSNAPWGQRSNSRENLASPAAQAQAFKNNLNRNDESPLGLDRLQQDIIHLRKNLDSLGEIDGLLENIDDLLSSMRRKIRELLDEINEKHRIMQDERIQVVEKSDAYAQSHRFAPPPGKKNDWGDHNFTKPN